MAGGITIRRVGPADVTAITQHFAAIFAEPDLWLPLLPTELPNEAGWLRNITDAQAESNSAWWLAEAEGCLVASLELRGGKRHTNQHIVTLGMNVAANHRGMGLGKTLLETGLAWVRQHPSVSRIELECFAANTAAVSLYTSASFVVEGRRVNRYLLRDDYHDTLHMSWQRPQP